MSIKVRFSFLVTKSVVYCVLGSIYDTHSLIPCSFPGSCFLQVNIFLEALTSFADVISSNKETKEGKSPSPATQAGLPFSFANRLIVEAF